VPDVEKLGLRRAVAVRPGSDDPIVARGISDTARFEQRFVAELVEPLVIASREVAGVGSLAVLRYSSDAEASRRARRPIAFIRLEAVTVQGVQVPVTDADDAKASVITRGPVVNVPAGTRLTFTAR
jgi:hypothetical protein